MGAEPHQLLADVASHRGVETLERLVERRRGVKLIGQTELLTRTHEGAGLPCQMLAAGLSEFSHECRLTGNQIVFELVMERFEGGRCLEDFYHDTLW